MTASDLIQYAVIAAVVGLSLWILARPYLRKAKAGQDEGGGCGSGEGCGSCKGCASLSALKIPDRD